MTNSQNNRNLPFVWNAFKVDVIIMLFSCEAGTWGSEYKDGGLCVFYKQLKLGLGGWFSWLRTCHTSIRT